MVAGPRLFFIINNDTGRHQHQYGTHWQAPFLTLFLDLRVSATCRGSSLRKTTSRGPNGGLGHSRVRLARSFFDGRQPIIVAYTTALPALPLPLEHPVYSKYDVPVRQAEGSRLSQDVSWKGTRCSFFFMVAERCSATYSCHKDSGTASGACIPKCRVGGTQPPPDTLYRECGDSNPGPCTEISQLLPSSSTAYPTYPTAPGGGQPRRPGWILLGPQPPPVFVFPIR